MRYFTAIRAASMAASKQSDGVDAATTGTGDSEFRPNRTISRSACSGFVGIPVDGPARWTSTTTSGSSSVTASPTVSDFRTMPGPAEVVTPSAPPKAAPSAAPEAAISSSAWNVRTPKCFRPASCSRTSDAGVIGYAPRKSGSPLSLLAATRPYVSAVLPGDLPVRPRRGLGRRDLVRAREVLGGLAVVPARLERLRVGLDDLGALRELLLDERERSLGRAVVEPRHEAEREEVLRPLRLARGDAVDALQRFDGHRRERDRVDVEVGERAVLERVRLVPRLLEVPVVEGVRVDDHGPALREVAEIHLERRGVHRHEDARLVARRQDVVVGEVDLEARDAGQRARGRTDLGREVGQRREVVPEEGGLAREAIARELHPVAGVAGEPDHDPFEVLDGLRCGHGRGIADAAA